MAEINSGKNKGRNIDGGVGAVRGNLPPKIRMATSDNLTRDDFDGGPVSLDEIEKGLWLGNVTAATDMDTLKTHKITNILTVDSCPLPAHVLQNPLLHTKYIQVSDVAKDDLLSHFEDCIHFIEKSLENKKIVLVHCYFGVSRSAAVVIAFIMKKYKISFTLALERVKSKRKFVGPNTGFIAQLRLFHKMGWQIDGTNEKFKIYRLRLAGDKVKKVKILPQTCMDIIKSDPGLIQTNPEPIVYRCKKCRRIVASRSNILTHRPPPPATAKQSNTKQHATNDNYNEGSNDKPDDERLLMIDQQLVDKMKISSTLNNSSDQSSQQSDTVTNECVDTEEYCRKIYFIEPLAWMDGIQKHTQGKLNCPKCKNKLGNFNWTMGCNCECGVQFSPAFYLVPSKVDLCHSVQNVQITV